MNLFFHQICNLNTEENEGKNELQKYNADNKKTYDMDNSHKKS